MKTNNKLKVLENHIGDMVVLYKEAERCLKMTGEDPSVYDTATLLEDYFKEVNGSYCQMEKNGAVFLPDGTMYIPGCDTYSRYPDGEYAAIAYALRSLNDKLLAFKYCYDRDFLPFDHGEDTAFCVYYDHKEKFYTYTMHDHCKCNTVYFSSELVAKKCCAWLNSQLAEDSISEAAGYMQDYYDMLTDNYDHELINL